MTSSEEDWRQHFPTYDFGERDIVLREYDTASRAVEADERVFLHATNITLVVAAGVGALVVGSLDTVLERLGRLFPEPVTLIVIVAITAVYSLVTLRYFSDRQKGIVFAARKMVVLRRMLGLSYGRFGLVLPNWRAEGANQPFAIRLFPGWMTYVCYPFWIVAGFSAVIVFVLGSALLEFLPVTLRGDLPSWTIGLILAGVWFSILGLVYRRGLFDAHETCVLQAAKGVGALLRLKLVEDFEYIFYRATLGRYEADRQDVDLASLRTMAVFVEDGTFFRHRGVSARGLARAVLGLVGQRTRSGGSTITQQLGRGLFIEDQTKIVRRKIVELILAFWLEQIASKREILDLYLVSVRFANGVYGVLDAMRYFFGDVRAALTKGRAFFLIERVSNVRGRVLGHRIKQTLERAVEAGTLTLEDVQEIVGIYSEMLQQGRLVEDVPGTWASLTQGYAQNLETPHP